MTRLLSFTPGSWTMIELPWRPMSGSATPRASTRARMIEIDVLSTPLSTFFSGWRTTERPPCRSRPRSGELPAASVAPRATTARPTNPSNEIQSERRTYAASLIGHLVVGRDLVLGGQLVLGVILLERRCQLLGLAVDRAPHHP